MNKMDEDRQPLLTAGDSEWSSQVENSRRSPQARSRDNDTKDYLDVVFVVSFDTKKGAFLK